MWIWLHRFGSPKYFYDFSNRAIPWLGWGCLVLICAGLYGGLVLAPPDYEQGESYRIIYVHVPSAWMSMFIYMNIAAASAVVLIWKVKIADVIAQASAPLGASFTFLALVTGSLWGKPMWGTWWQWDARLTSELLLLFIYLGYMGLGSAIEDRRVAARACAILALVGVVNIPIIHYSVEWWNTLHQPASITKLGKPSIHSSMLIPLLIMAIAFMLYYVVTVLSRARCELLRQERKAKWVQEVVIRAWP